MSRDIPSREGNSELHATVLVISFGCVRAKTASATLVTESVWLIGRRRVIGGFIMHTQQMLVVLAASLALITVGSSDIASAHSGGGGGFHGGGGFRGAGGNRGSGGFRGGGGYRRGSYWGRGGYGWRGGYRGWGWGGLGYGLFFASLPWYYDTYWWDGAPYYYADDVYYQWNGDANAYETVQPPAGLTEQVQAQALVSRKLFAYPTAGQSSEQQATDREDCHRWAVAQSGFDPRVATNASMGLSASTGATTGGTAASQEAVESTAAKRADYLRADEACLEGRNYSVK